MAAAPRSRSSTFAPSEQWLLMTVAILVCGFLGHVVYDAIMATASELLQRLLVILPLLLVVVVHWMSTGWNVNFPMPGSETCAIPRAGGSPWDVAFVLLLLFFLICFQPWGVAFVAFVLLLLFFLICFQPWGVAFVLLLLVLLMIIFYGK